MHLPSMTLSTENGLLRHNSIESWEKSVNKMSLYRCITVAFTQWKIPGWFPVWGGHKYSCQEYSGTDFCVNIILYFTLKKIPRNEITGSNDTCMSNFIRNCKTLFTGGPTFLHLYHQCLRALVASLPALHLIFKFLVVSLWL